MESLGKFGLAIQGLREAEKIIRDVGGEILGMVKDAATLQGVEEAFDGITKAAGKNADEVLRSFKKFSAEMLTERDAMLSYNMATQLVGEQFANTLPEAMGYLSKIASATGQDMGFMTDSLVKGIGRLSPMILDNLGIQVDLNEAYTTYAASIGKSADELTKQEKQTALLNQVMDKLKTNTAAMPDVAGQADTKMARFGATMEDIRGKIGMFFIPIFTDVLDILNSAANAVMVLVTGDFKGGIFGLDEDHPFITVLFMIRDFFRQVGEGVPFFDALTASLENVARAADRYGMTEFAEGLRSVKEFIMDIIKPIANWIEQNITLNDVLMAVGVTIASIVVPALISIGAAIAGPLAAFAALVGVIALIRQAWDSNFLGIRDFILNSFIPALQEVIRVVGETIGKVIEWIQEHPDLVVAIGGVIAVLGIAATATWAWNTAVVVLTASAGTLLSPILLVTGAIAALLVLLSSGEGGIAGALSRAATAAQQLAAIVGYVLAGVFFWFNTNVIEPIRQRLAELWQTIQNIIDGIRNLGKSSLPEVTTQVTGVFGNIQQGLANYIAQNTPSRDYGGPGFAGNPYQIGVPEIFVPNSGGEFIPLGGAGESMGNQITIQFMGTGGPTNQQEAEDVSYMIVGGMRARGVEV